MAKNSLASLRAYLPEIRFLFYHVKNHDRVSYIKQSKSGLVEILAQIGLNLVYCKKNNLEVTEAQCKRLRKHKAGLQRLIITKSTKKKRDVLTLPLLNTLLSVIISVMSKMGLDV